MEDRQAARGRSHALSRINVQHWSHEQVVNVEPAAGFRRPKVRGIFHRLLETVAGLILTAWGQTRRDGLMLDTLHLDVVAIAGVTPGAYGLEATGTRSPTSYRTDFAVLLRYQNGWAKAETEDWMWRRAPRPRRAADAKSRTSKAA